MKRYANALARQQSIITQLIITIEPGEYSIDTTVPIPLCSNLTVHVEGAVFYFPGDLGAETNRKMFLGVDCQNITWHGGRGNWFNTPKNAIISNNIFIRNTKKCTPDINVGRICHVTGDFEHYPELYFTSYNNEKYGPLIISGNIFETEVGTSAAIAFNDGGHDIILENNIVKGDVTDIHVAKNCQMPEMKNIIGFGKIVEQTFINTANAR